jgi:hypothetical protein
MVDAVDLGFGKMLADRFVDLDGRFEVVAKRFFEHHPGLVVDQAGIGQLVADDGKQRRRRRQVEHPLSTRMGGRGKGAEVRRLLHVETHVLEQCQVAVPGFLVEIVARDERARMFFDVGQIGLAVEFLASGRDDAGLGGQIAVQVGHVERRKQLAHRQVAHAAEDDHVEGKTGVSVCRRGHFYSQLVEQGVAAPARQEAALA